MLRVKLRTQGSTGLQHHNWDVRGEVILNAFADLMLDEPDATVNHCFVEDDDNGATETVHMGHQLSCTAAGAYATRASAVHAFAEFDGVCLIMLPHRTNQL